MSLRAAINALGASHVESSKLDMTYTLTKFL
jgi:hypothetical protein